MWDSGLWSILQIFVRIGHVWHTDASAKSCAGVERMSVTNQDTSSPKKTKIQSLPPRFILEVGASEQPDRFSFESPRLHRIMHLSSTKPPESGSRKWLATSFIPFPSLLLFGHSLLDQIGDWDTKEKIPSLVKKGMKCASCFILLI